ncbi:MAG TPA: DNA repair protein RecO [Actinomycetota bacterium]|nr:DNA repair protein RecO [Actinomycetota bacterium]
MPGLYKDEAVVLKTIKLGEADRIVTLFTRDHGKVRAVAKGIRKTKSRFGARLEPFTHVAVLVYRGRSLDTITQADIVTSFHEVRAEYASLTAAAALVELVEKVTPDRERAASTYRLLLHGLQALRAGHTTTVVPAFLVKLLSISGYHPQLTTCAGCGETSAGLGGFSPALGGAVCASCWRDDRDALEVSVDRLRLLGRLLERDFGEPAGAAEADEVTHVLRRYAEYHLERPLRSLRLLPSAR